MKIKFLSTIAVITPDPPASRALYVGALGLPLQSGADGEYWHSEQIGGCKHFGVWPLSQTALACFGTPDGPADRPVLQMSLEFEATDADAVSPPPRTCVSEVFTSCTIGARSHGARRSRGFDHRRARSSGSPSRPRCMTNRREGGARRAAAASPDGLAA